MNQTCTSSHTVALMDSHPLTLFGLSTLIKSVDKNCEISLRELSLVKMFDALMYLSVDILVTDLQSADETFQEGIDCLLRINARFPAMNIVVYTSCHDSNILRRLLDHYNISVIARGESLADTQKFFKQAFEQQRVLSPKICSDLARINESYQFSPARLTRSELDVLRYMYNGKDLQNIARIKQLSIKTISAHKCNAMRKLDISSDSELFLQLNHIFN
ncbi:two-component system, NarL family, captular synthesis response regulator RcsB [Izhakiella capsodis]|uniref:Two-component system, NarL family, captular synthesis response regulator RcsB n=1 Tax=Izhakiella capsodis TaxID=1367852 RepID=A0A1I4XF35_9GAMM|nr:response regulator transcription factor [Izhakiella capsodis]SFN24385.1 two-component system, NarL family, captular synthesis response regulator RcsB [Izhakiella capsodis]